VSPSRTCRFRPELWDKLSGCVRQRSRQQSRKDTRTRRSEGWRAEASGTRLDGAEIAIAQKYCPVPHPSLPFCDPARCADIQVAYLRQAAVCVRWARGTMHTDVDGPHDVNNCLCSSGGVMPLFDNRSGHMASADCSPALASTAATDLAGKAQRQLSLPA
jgi:hypothetical protein